MNSRKAILYISIMLLVPFIVSYLIGNVKLNTSESLYLSIFGSLIINSQIFFLGFVIEGIKYIRGKYKETPKVFWLEWIESTFAIWIVGIIIIGLVQSYLRFF